MLQPLTLSRACIPFREPLPAIVTGERGQTPSSVVRLDPTQQQTGKCLAFAFACLRRFLVLRSAVPQVAFLNPMTKPPGLPGAKAAALATIPAPGIGS